VEVYNPYTHEKEVFTRDLERDYSYQVKPYNFKPVYVSNSETSTLIFDKSMKRWISSEYLSRMEKKALNEYQRKVNEEMIKRFVDFQSAKTLVELLTKIPNFRVKLTEEEKNVIGENGNVLVIGRSGTGKTTCAVLRLFAI
jgi:flagellar biosynthesis GTPase FlhF